MTCSPSGIPWFGDIDGEYVGTRFNRNRNIFANSI
jgi:hypothetical protein